MTNFYSVVQYENAAGETDFTVSFPYLRQDHVFVYIDGELYSSGTYEFIDQQTIRLSEPLDSSEVLTIRRFTFKDARLAEYTDGSILTALELNEVSLQLLYIVQELHDFRQIGDDPDVSIPGNPEDADVPSTVISDLIDQLQETPIFQTLTSLIPLVDVSAEAIISNALEQHDNWKSDGLQNELRRQFEIETGANIVNLQSTIESETEALANTLSAVTARVDASESSIINLETSFAGQQSTFANVLTELSSKLNTDDLDAELAQSSIIDGLETSVSNVDGRITAETASINSQISQIDNNIGIVQSTANTAVTRTDTLAEAIYRLASQAPGDPDSLSPTSVAASLQNQYETYATNEANRARSEAITTLTAEINDAENTISAVQTSLTTDINQVENDVGDLVTEVDSQYALRMNLTRGSGPPVIAGIGLGLSGSSNAGFRSDFIVMADNFSIIAPPTNGNFENGQLVDDPVVPFVVDSQSGTVIINGDLFISDTLYAYEGRLREVVAGKITLGQLYGDPQGIDPNWNSLVNPNGQRLELSSSTNGYWTGSDRNYLIWAGSGTRNDNNANFWLDSGGNAFFGGQVRAAGVTGSMMDVLPIDYTASSVTTAPANGAWVTIGNAIFQANATTNRARRPFAIITMSMFGAGQQGGEAKLEMRTGSNGNFGGWEEVARHTNNMAQFASALTLSGGMTSTTTGDVQLRVQIREINGNQPSSNKISGVLMALPAGTSGQILADGGGSPSGGSGSVPTTQDDSPYDDYSSFF